MRQLDALRNVHEVLQGPRMKNLSLLSTTANTKVARYLEIAQLRHVCALYGTSKDLDDALPFTIHPRRYDFRCAGVASGAAWQAPRTQEAGGFC